MGIPGQFVTIHFHTGCVICSGLNLCPAAGMMAFGTDIVLNPAFVSGGALPALAENATVLVIGAGPAGSFFAIQALREARRRGRKINLLILERKQELRFYQGSACGACREGCNYCAGGISPKLAALLKQDALDLPPDVVMGRAESLTIHGDWKSIELPVPAGKEMLFVFRGSRPRHRPGRHENFDSYLLGKAVQEGAKLVTGEVQELLYSDGGKPLVRYRAYMGPVAKELTVEADFVAVAAGVNQSPGMELEENQLYQSLRKCMPGFRPPRVRKALIAEMETDETVMRHIRGEVHFAQYGSHDLHIEMSSLIPKKQWVTVVLLGESVDQAGPDQRLRVIQQFLELPHIRRILTRNVRLDPCCVCHPNMTVGVAQNGYAHRMAVIGDMAVARLYKDGILSAHITASALVKCIFEIGTSRASLRRGYWPTVRRVHRDNQFGAVVFFLNRVTFSHPVLSRIVYQAVVTERKKQRLHNRRLADLLWKIASGDDSYTRVFLSMFRPSTIWLILVGGVLVTLRNYLAEGLFGLTWAGFGRYPTGVPKEDVEKKRREVASALGIQPRKKRPQFERMYSIKIMADPEAIFHELGRFGDSDRKYFKPRMVKVYRTAGEANEVGSVIRYDVWPKWMSFSILLEQVIGTRYLMYRVRDGFAEGGILVFDIEQEQEGQSILSIYLAFDLPKSKSLLKRAGWWLFGLTFPAFTHDVLWNHALCELKHWVQADQRHLPLASGSPSTVSSYGDDSLPVSGSGTSNTLCNTAPGARNCADRGSGIEGMGGGPARAARGGAD